MRRLGQSMLMLLVSAVCFIIFLHTTHWILFFASIAMVGAALYALGEKLISRLLTFAGCTGALLSAVVMVLAAFGFGAI